MWVDVGSRCPAVLQTCRSFKGLSPGAGVGGGGAGGGEGGGGGYSRFQVTRMIEWGQKSKPPKISREHNLKISLDKNLPLEILIPSHKNFQKTN